MATSGSAPDVLLDTSAAVPLVVGDHVLHDVTIKALDGRRLGLAGHAAFETFSVLTRLPVPARRPPSVVARLLAANFPESRFLSAEGAQRLLATLAAGEVTGGSIYDALVGAAAVEHEVALATHDRRALDVYRLMGVEVELLPTEAQRDSGLASAPLATRRDAMNKRDGRMGTVRRGFGVLAVVMVVLVGVSIVTSRQNASAGAGPPNPNASALPGPIGHHGRWVTDADGRVLLLHGVNFVAKVDGETPAEMGFGDDDAQFLADNGFDVVRLGLTAGSIMPSPGVIDTAYLASFRQTIDTITDHGLLVLVDLHQDGWGPSLGSDGFPEWMTITHGAENTHTDFPLYYITNPAIQAAFDSFWNNEAGPENVNIQDRVGTMMAALAQSVGDNPGVLGYDLLNEPWPGTVWQPCATDPAGCPEQDQALDGYNARMAQAIRTQDATRLLLGEPYVLFNFGGAPTNITLPGNDPNSGMSYHLYTADPASEPAVQDFAVEWANNTCGALMNTEFGATTDVAAIDRQVKEIDGSLIPWIWWAYNENFAGDMSQPVGATPINEPVVNTLVRPHPRAVAGTPWLNNYDLATRSMQFTYSTTPVDGGTWPAGTESEFQVAPRTYPEGYDARVLGGTVTSAPDAEVLTVAANAGSTEVTVLVWPAGQPEPPVVAVSMVAVDDPCATTPDAPTTPVADTQPAVEPNFTG